LVPTLEGQSKKLSVVRVKKKKNKEKEKKLRKNMNYYVNPAFDKIRNE